MRNYIVECWKGEDYDAGKTGLFVKVKANNDSHAEDKAMRQTGYDVVECVGLASVVEGYSKEMASEKVAYPHLRS